VGRPRSVHDDDLIKAARELFHQRGSAVTTRDIAAASGISQAVLFQRFGSKEDLFFRAMTPGPPDVDELMGPYPPTDVRRDLAKIVDRLATYLSSLLPSLMHVLAHASSDPSRIAKWHATLPVRAIVEAFTKRVERLRADGLIGDVAPGAVVELLLAAAHHAAFSSSFAAGVGHGSKPGRASAVLEVLWSGIQPKARPSGSTRRASPRAK